MFVDSFVNFAYYFKMNGLFVGRAFTANWRGLNKIPVERFDVLPSFRSIRRRERWSAEKGDTSKMTLQAYEDPSNEPVCLSYNGVGG
jgi:hypothetical protein